MKTFTTTLKAVDPKDGMIKNWCGPHIDAPTRKDAELWKNKNGLGYLKITGELVCEIDDGGLAELLQRHRNKKYLN